jgi:hypothetical protein
MVAAAALSDMDWSDDGHGSARDRYRQAKIEWRSAHSETHQLAARAAVARKDLAADDVRRASHEAVIRDGEQAWTELTETLRTTIGRAVSDGKWLPVWLDNCIGPMPQPGKEAAWLNVAIEILAYRITYKVQDPLVPLGPQPPSASERRTDWAGKIETAIRKLQE